MCAPPIPEIWITMSKKPSPKEDQIKALREARVTGRPIAAKSQKDLLRKIAVIEAKKKART
jgi:hypothetical protein